MVDKKVVSKNDSSKKDRDTALRYLAMLSCIPMEPARISTKMIHDNLARQGYEVDVRTVQRNLVDDLSAKFPLCCTEEGRSYFWSFIKGSSSQWPAMNLDAALGVLLVENNLREQLPVNIAESLEPLVGQARATLETLDKKGYKKVLTKSLRVIPKGLQLQKAEIAPGVLGRIFDALVRKCQLEIIFRGKPSIVNPLGLVVKGAVTYLVCTFDGFEVDAYRTPAVNRISDANVQAKDAVIPAGFDLDKVIASGKLQWILDDGKPQRFELEVWHEFISILEETPINETQQIVRGGDDDEWVRVKFEAPDTMELRHWIMSMGNNIVVAKPAKIRKEFIQMAKQVLENYGE